MLQCLRGTTTVANVTVALVTTQPAYVAPPTFVGCDKIILSSPAGGSTPCDVVLDNLSIRNSTGPCTPGATNPCGYDTCSTTNNLVYTCPFNATRFHCYNNTEVGSTYQYQTINYPNPAQGANMSYCQQQCDNLPSCNMAATALKFDMTQAQCFLKGAPLVTSGTYGQNRITTAADGWRVDICMDHPSAYGNYVCGAMDVPGTALTANIPTGGRGSSACAELCQARSDCEFYVYYSSPQSCSLRKTPLPNTSSSGAAQTCFKARRT
ncbi:hypothetical protein HYH03_011337 [Edaphochlamys debaryana]|uniref:Apple domain-containing protein n=1 Tax=Edaphochlamys debaryana TaxID=47281 RepID=A0A836BV94_9CHLO|nr:hypothetical protein HYH03_011337 [Edaphochlamys debaryana]|eukprot:KAG2490210.1 hypothetical protein HYH03_011337 [Edaphochlamys debaryana]